MIKIQKNIPLAPYTTFKIGGPAKFFCEVKSEEELIEALNYSKNNNLGFFVLGGGSNILISDQGFNGLVIKLLITSCELQVAKLKCGAGLNLSEAVKIATDNSLTGLEWAAGIPGTIGGAIRGNAGAGILGGPMSINIESVKVLDVLNNFEFMIIRNDECGFDYRDSVFKHNTNLVIVSAVLKLQKGDKEEIENKIKDIIGKRTGKFPKEPSPGSFFKNPVVKNTEIIEMFEKDTSLKMKDDKVPAGWLISEAGLLGKKIGQIQISEKHGNFIINLGGGKAEDVIMLMSVIKQKIRKEFNVQLNEEIVLAGF
jgi:UDP-N-acetylmuramate dehydrogenase